MKLKIGMKITRCRLTKPGEYWQVVFIGEKRIFSKHWNGSEFNEESNPIEDDWIKYVQPKKCKTCGRVI